MDRQINKQINIKLFPKMSDTESKDLNKQLLDVICQIDKYDDASRLSIVSKLLNDGANPNFMVGNDCTILKLTIMYEYTDIVKLLLDHNANPNLLSINSNNALMLASCFGNIKIIEMLLNTGVDINEINKYNSTALANACFSRENYIDTVKLLLSRGANPNIIDIYGYSPLMKAIENNKIEIAEILLSHGADPNITSKYGWSALLLATSYITEQRYKLIQKLVSYGVNINIMNSKGHTPLLNVIECRNEECIEFLSTKMIEQGTLIDELPDEIYDFPNVIKKLYWIQRKSYISFMEGCSSDNSHLTKYLFNGLVCREICELI
jgi:ankyrin repeat protein